MIYLVGVSSKPLREYHARQPDERPNLLISYPAIIERAFEDIKNTGLILDYKVVANGGKFSKGYIEVEK